MPAIARTRPWTGTAATALAVLLGALMAANGAAMLWDPNAWYLAVPGVPATGPFNQHFVRDIGLVYLLIGAAFAAGAFSPGRAIWFGAATAWLAGHALFHLWEVAVGICTADAIPRDFAGVTLPALWGLALTLFSLRRVDGASSTDTVAGSSAG